MNTLINLTNKDFKKIIATRDGNHAVIIKSPKKGGREILQVVISEYEAGKCPQKLSELDVHCLSSIGVLAVTSPQQ
jgi:hypothetical protein